MTYRKKLIEVALPLDAINREASADKTISKGHPSRIHLWWARRPLAACRAVLFASLVDDPSSRAVEFPTEKDQQRERERLFKLIEELVKWENIDDERIMGQAREEILKSTDGNPPSVLDPFCGGGSIPLEAQRLGLAAHASDLNPVAVLITKAIIELPVRFAGHPPVNPDAQHAFVAQEIWNGAIGLAEDVRFYGKSLCEKAEKHIGHLYPKIQIPSDQGRTEGTVIAWLWARTVKCPNPACQATMPLIKTFWLSRKRGKRAWVSPIVDKTAKTVRFEVVTGENDTRFDHVISSGTGFLDGSGRRVKSTFKCLVCSIGVAKGDYIDAEANAGRMGVVPLAVVAKSSRRRAYVSIDKVHLTALKKAEELLSNPAFACKVPAEPAHGTFARTLKVASTDSRPSLIISLLAS